MVDTLVCSIELSKTAGVTVLVKKGDQVTQTITMDGTTVTIAVEHGDKKTTITQDAEGIELNVKGPADTSTVVQKADKVEITCRSFKVTAESVEISSSADTKHSAEGAYSVTSGADLSLSSRAALGTSSVGATTLSALGAFEASALGDATLRGQKALVEGLIGTTVQGVASLDLKALQIVAAAGAKFEAAGPMTTIGKNLTTVSGQLVRVQAARIQLG